MVCTLSTERSPSQTSALAVAAGSAFGQLAALDMSSASSQHQQQQQQQRLPTGAPQHHLHLPHQLHAVQQQQLEQQPAQSQAQPTDERSSSAGSSMGSCSPPPGPGGQSPGGAAGRPAWLHEFASPHVLQLLNLNAAGSMLAASQPLAALHSMAERSQHQQQHQQPGPGSPTGSGKQSPATSIGSVGSNPHGIDTILSRPAPPVLQPPPQPAQPQLGPASRYAMHAGFAASAGIGQFQQRTEPRHPAIYWPGLQGLVSDPLAWRARLHSLSQQLGCQQQAMAGSGAGAGPAGDHEPGKKKHTRPTFSGQQIFALEKTFEQTKYLAGPERAKLAYALGMSESQVKVWFQNRRTKWRKKHAAEMATAKRRQEEVEGVAGEAEDGSLTSDGEAATDGQQDTAAKRLRRELEQQFGP